MKLTVKGGAAVDPDSGPHECPTLFCLFFSLSCFFGLDDDFVCLFLGLENSAHVLEQGGKMYSATLGLVDIVRGTNSYYKLQLLEDDVQKRSVSLQKILSLLFLTDKTAPLISFPYTAPHPFIYVQVLGVQVLGQSGHHHWRQQARQVSRQELCHGQLPGCLQREDGQQLELLQLHQVSQ